MPEPRDIQIPAVLVPRDGRFGSGPARVRAAQLEDLSRTGISFLGTSHRQRGVRSVVHDIRRGLSDLYDLPDGYEVLLGVGGATAFWEAAAFSLIERRSQHLIFGEFSGKFAAVASGAPWLDDPETIESAPGSHPLPIVDPEIDAYCLTHNETSTGVMMPIRRPGGGSALVLVDGTSAAGAVTVDPEEFDAYYFSPQKALGSEGGLWISLCSPNAVNRLLALAKERWIPPFLNLSVALANSRKDQTYNTPALATLFLLERQLTWLSSNGGLEWASDRCRVHAAMLYDWADKSDYATPFVTNPVQRSTTTVTIDLVTRVPVNDLLRVLAGHGIIDIAGYRKLERNQIRIATFPAVDTEDIEKLIASIDFVTARLSD